MSTHELFEREGIHGFLRPISSEAPGGVATYHHPLVREIEQARREDADLPRGVWQIERKTAQWPKVAALATKILVELSKDFRVAAWLGQAWTELEGWPGYRRGLILLLGLAEGFWDRGHPSLDEEGLDARLAPIVWYVDGLVPRLRCLTIGESGSGRVLSLDLWGRATRLEQLRARDKRAAEALEADGELGTEGFGAELRTLAKPELAALHAELEATRAACVAVQARLEQLAGDQAPSLRGVVGVITELREMFDRHLPGGLAALAPAPAPTPVFESTLAPIDAEPSDDLDPSASASTPEVPRIRDRDHAYRLLHEVAEYLARTEPHSPSPYLIRRVVSWGQLELDQLLPQLINKPDDLHAIFALLGLPRT